MKTFNREQIGKAIHYMLSGFKIAVGQRPYKHWEDLDARTKKLFEDAIDYVLEKKPDAKGIHDYWMEYAQEVDPTHESIIPFEDLSAIEKLKDEFVIMIVHHMNKYNEEN